MHLVLDILWSIARSSEHDTAPISDSITKEPWYKDYKKEHTHGGDFSVDQTDLGKVLHLRIYNHGLLLKEHHGVYDINEDVRVKNRESIIERFWEYGFATWRGRPPTVAQLRWSGPREHLEDLVVLADRLMVAAAVQSLRRSAISVLVSGTLPPVQLVVVPQWMQLR